jgi:hypothetical protein
MPVLTDLNGYGPDSMLAVIHGLYKWSTLVDCHSTQFLFLIIEALGTVTHQRGPIRSCPPPNYDNHSAGADNIVLPCVA